MLLSPTVGYAAGFGLQSQEELQEEAQEVPQGSLRFHCTLHPSNISHFMWSRHQLNLHLVARSSSQEHGLAAALWVSLPYTVLCTARDVQHGGCGTCKSHETAML